MNPFITFRDTDKDNRLQYYILQRDFPHCIGLVTSEPPETSLAKQPILGYRLWIVFAGTLRGNFVPGYPNAIKELEAAILSMANWFYEKRVVVEPKKYKKYVSVPSK